MPLNGEDEWRLHKWKGLQVIVKLVLVYGFETATLTKRQKAELAELKVIFYLFIY